MSVLKIEDRKKIAKSILLHTDETDLNSFNTYFNYYESVVYFKDDIDRSILHRAFESHDVILGAVELLHANPAVTRGQLKELTFAANSVLPDREKEAAIRKIVLVGFMLDCGYEDEKDADENRPTFRIEDFVSSTWTSQESFNAFIARSFRKENVGHSGFKYHDVVVDAWMIQKRGIRIRLTDNMIEHLFYDSGSRTLLVFRQIGYLRAISRKLCQAVAGDEKTRHLKSWVMPPQLLFETLSSIQDLLFHRNSEASDRSRPILAGLIAEGLDPGVSNYVFVRGLPENFIYQFWAARLARLAEVLKQPPPASGSFMSWLEWHTSERNALTVAVLALILTVIFGFLSLIIGIAQLWISILAWKYPASPPTP